MTHPKTIQRPAQESIRQDVKMSDGVDLKAYCQFAAGDRPWVIFSNSLMTDWRIWSSQAAILSGDWNILRYDQRGHGASGCASGATNFHRLGTDVIALLDHYAVERAAFVGLSMGVPTGLAAFSLSPERFSGLMLCDGQPKTAPGGQKQWSARIAEARTTGMHGYAATAARRWLAEPDEPLSAELFSMMSATAFGGFAACAGALADFDFCSVLPKIDVPTLLVAGQNDGQLPETMRLMAETIPSATFETVVGAGHVPCFEKPEAFNAIMLSFLDRLT
ncbi:alpha/beta fold hydrolase [Rhizobium sp. L1K21]|uniref:alpha/beta fold hydrolase n=1 Tax=Rhizobium sp. L1K21 TaxID=2954933 RepID=UPI0020934E5C|nr:alpha/beta fold hydrolase [Rhizobium sp. L1K21]MCO6188422.1 alpha/beta fold hydrolase [Rhizobium sp. L1K21]